MGEAPILGEMVCFMNKVLFSIWRTSSSSLWMIELEDCNFSFIFSLFILFSLDRRPGLGDRLFSSSELSDPFIPISSEMLEDTISKPDFYILRKNFWAWDRVYGHVLLPMYRYIEFQFLPYNFRPSKNFLCSSSVHFPELNS